jgi:hypothetical protein
LKTYIVGGFSYWTIPLLNRSNDKEEKILFFYVNDLAFGSGFEKSFFISFNFFVTVICLKPHKMYANAKK